MAADVVTVTVDWQRRPDPDKAAQLARILFADEPAAQAGDDG